MLDPLGSWSPQGCACMTGGQSLIETAVIAFVRIATGTLRAALPATRRGPPNAKTHAQQDLIAGMQCHAVRRTRKRNNLFQHKDPDTGRSASPGATAPADPQPPATSDIYATLFWGPLAVSSLLAVVNQRGGFCGVASTRRDPSVASLLGHTAQQRQHADREADRAPGLPHCSKPGQEQEIRNLRQRKLAPKSLGLREGAVTPSLQSEDSEYHDGEMDGICVYFSTPAYMDSLIPCGSYLGFVIPMEHFSGPSGGRLPKEKLVGWWKWQRFPFKAI
ncbi:unnamed protein product [Notodromas monacha]|uniref:Uncharacterized protein n=1 Tax=Notodromas monacha TaxID=399045 RepID=A0A7R9C000_9CRUS|nr:unnamed protein product [Notodromas monacha]CAG0923633.1 unnamed protein product [Notodromas monacha]